MQIENNQKIIDQLLQSDISEQHKLLIQKQENDSRLDITFNKCSTIRSMQIILDVSSSMKHNDFKPNRFIMVQQTLHKMIDEYFDKNPLSSLGILTMNSGLCITLADISMNKYYLIKQLEKLTLSNQNEISIQNSLEMAIVNFVNIPLYVNKEILLILSSTSTQDPGDIYKTIQKLKDFQITTNVIHLGGKIRIADYISKQTNGQYEVPINDLHFQQILKNYKQVSQIQEKTCRALVQIAFPIKKFASDKQYDKQYCSCHCKVKTDFFECPVCNAILCTDSVPGSCVICNTSLVTSPHLARTNFQMTTRLEKFELITDSLQSQCFGCRSIYEGNNNFSRCLKCNSIFCLECDIFLHENLKICPGCN